jgi:hypothetical protein
MALTVNETGAHPVALPADGFSGSFIEISHAIMGDSLLQWAGYHAT